MNDEISRDRIAEFFDTIRKAEVRNDKTGAYDDKQMAIRISKYLQREAAKDLAEEEES